MTGHEFDQLSFHGDMFVLYNGKKSYVVTANFPERLFGLLPEKPLSFNSSDADEVTWVRCESVSAVIDAEILPFP